MSGSLAGLIFTSICLKIKLENPFQRIKKRNHKNKRKEREKPIPKINENSQDSVENHKYERDALTKNQKEDTSIPDPLIIDCNSNLQKEKGE